MRLPRRVLGLLPMAEIMDETGSAWNPQRHLEIFGLGGQWFDCRDVEGYLRDQGVNLEGSSLFAEVCDTTPHTLEATNLQGSKQPSDSTVNGESELSLSGSVPISGLSAGGETVSADSEDAGIPASGQRASRYILDIERFFTRLLHGVVILGRAPGFRRTDVEVAFKSALLYKHYPDNCEPCVLRMLGSSS
ncbi:hypothetical protein VTN00DRAFT_6661 [Thermoascus crustaceus]|uniref:uncharacterized protein n=1 Tax=Thermoascus crustaceus TaxID=5088 RepID=UPI0037439AC8